MKKNTLACSGDTLCNKRILERFDSLTCQMIFCMCQSFYYDKQPIMSNEEFDNLKEELMWEGSSVVMLSSDEQKFMEASLAYVAGRPILTDQQYDELKMKLKVGKMMSKCSSD
jgi:NAD-dependent DNA ligase